jgi:PhzF family phenazine biosynthesis protein
MQIPTYHIDAFTDKLFSGNPAAVCILDKWLEDDLLFSIAKENNLPVTAFILRENNLFKIRWITPDDELSLCGHGTLAASFVIFNFIELTWNKITFESTHEQLEAVKENGGITLNFPAKSLEKSENISFLEQGLGVTPQEVYQLNNERCLVVLQSEDEVKNLNPNRMILKKVTHRGIIVTAPGKYSDIVSRTFYPQKKTSFFEDAATGASHCLLTPYWSKRLNKTELHCKQISERG